MRLVAGNACQASRGVGPAPAVLIPRVHPGTGWTPLPAAVAAANRSTANAAAGVFEAALQAGAPALPRQQRIVAAKATSAATGSSTAAASQPADLFYAEASTYEPLGLSPAVQVSLAGAGFPRPSRVQELASPPILRGRNVVITAETGSGKTLAYVAPIVSLVLKQRAALLQHQLEQQQAPEQPERPRMLRYHALVLCPNVALCQQVASVVTSLRGQDNAPLATAAIINSSNPPPFDPPDFILATPQGFLTLVGDVGASYGWLWSVEGMATRVRHVVLDEADLLLGEAYRKATDKVLMLFRTADRRRVEAKLFEELGINKEEFDRLPRPLQQAGWRGGAPAMLAEGYKPKQALDPEAKYGPYWRRQYVYAAATMPSATRSDVGSIIQKTHPDAEWVSTELLHTSKPQLEHTWHEVTDETFSATLLSAVTRDPGYRAGTTRTIVFAADGASANRVAALLAASKLPHVLYHRSRPQPEQQAALAAFREQPGTVMVCTDAAARGLDVQDVGHVVQADFAPNAIDFIHRIGRTARAAGSGRVTSLYRQANQPLVSVLQGYIAEGMPLEAAFSRARSFSKKLRKTGGVFVPRGASAAAGDKEAAQGQQEAR